MIRMVLWLFAAIIAISFLRGVIGIFLIQRTSGGTASERDSFRAMAEAASLD